MSETDPIALDHIAPLQEDSIPDGNQSHFCFSCEEPVTGLYCAACGQKNDDYRRSILSLIKETLASITAIESRIWRTWAALIFQPGRVAREFSNGRRSYWSSPVRVYLAMSIILFGFLSVSQTQIFNLDVDVAPKKGVTKPGNALTIDDVVFDLDIGFFQTQRAINARNAEKNFDLIRQKITSFSDFDITVTNNGITSQKTPSETTIIENPSDPIETVDTGSIDEGNSNDPLIINGQPIDSESFADVAIMIIQEPGRLNNALKVFLPRIMFAMMPFTMLIGAIFIRGRGNALLYDHLVHAAYIHAFMFFLLILGIFLSRITSGDFIIKAISLSLLIYLPLSLKHMFKRGWIKTFWASYGVGLIYLISILTIMSIIILRQLIRQFG